MNDQHRRLVNVAITALSLLEVIGLQAAIGVNWLEPLGASLLNYRAWQIAVILATVALYMFLPGIHWWGFNRLEDWYTNQHTRVEVGGLTDADYEA